MGFGILASSSPCGAAEGKRRTIVDVSWNTRGLCKLTIEGRLGSKGPKIFAAALVGAPECDKGRLPASGPPLVLISEEFEDGTLIALLRFLKEIPIDRFRSQGADRADVGESIRILEISLTGSFQTGFYYLADVELGKDAYAVELSFDHEANEFKIEELGKKVP